MDQSEELLTEEGFFHCFQDVIRDVCVCSPEEVKKIYQNASRWTEIVMNGVEQAIWDRSDLKTEREYYRVDLIGYEPTTMDYDGKFRQVELYPYSWNLMLAFEHENSRKSWLDEVNKLAHLRCRLKVVVGYSRDMNLNPERLRLCGKILQSLRYGCPLNTPAPRDERWLIILGPTDPAKYDQLEMQYQGYRYDYDCAARQENPFVRIDAAAKQMAQ